MARNKNPEETVKLILDAALGLFMEKGFDNTSIQDIINHMGGLSKGAIYHHFKSKEEIFDAVFARLAQQSSAFYVEIRDDALLNGKQKLQKMMRGAYENPVSGAVVQLIEHLARDPKYLQAQYNEMLNEDVPLYIQPVLEEGIRDGSLTIEQPKLLAEMMLILANLWCNPVLCRMKRSQMRERMQFFNGLMRTYGIDLIDDDLLEQILTRFDSCYVEE